MTSARPRLSVLIVEDEGIIAENIRELLVELGYDASGIATTAEEAVAFALERCPDVVLMDIRIKGALDGIGTAVLLKERFDVPIIYLTAHADDATVERAKKTEPFGYLIKPVKAVELRSAIEVARYKSLMERHLRAQGRWFSSTVQSIADAVIMVDLGGKITFMNPAAEVLTGSTLAQAKHRPARDVLCLLDGDDLTQRGETPLDRALREQQPVFIPDTVLQSSGGARRLISDSAAPVMDGTVLLGAVMVFRDVTEQKRSQQQVQIADRLASLGTMAAGVAHEINNPLAIVLGNAEFVLESLERAQAAGLSDSTAAEHPKTIQEIIEAHRELLAAAGRIARIVSELKAFSRPEPEASGSADVRDAIEWAIRSTMHELRHRARVTMKFERVPRVDADDTRLGQVLVNLLINAAHAIAPGDVDANEVSIATSLDDQGRIVIAVSDTGGGMPEEVLSRIFEPFFTTKPTGIGTGLGLSICRGIVTSMGGELDVESSVGKGSTFRIKLPASAKQEPPLSPLPEPLAGQLRGRLLLIDDESMVLKALTRILDVHDIVCFEDARQALARLRDDDRFDIIFCDVMMPHMTGMDFYEDLLSWHPEAAGRVVFLTGGAMTARAAHFLAAVPNRCIEKPFGTRNLRALVQELLQARRG